MSSPSASTEATGGRIAFVGSLTLRDLVLLALIAALCMLAKQLLRIPIHIPGHSGVLWVALFVVARGLVDKRGAGVLLGIVTGVLAGFMGFGGDQGPFEWTKWVAAGITLDVMAVVLPGDLRSPLKAAIVGASIHLAKLTAMVLVSVALRLPLAIIALGIGWSATTHVAFGVVGGLLGALALRELRRVPALDAQARGL
jgi:hypothetical protein